MFYDFSLGIRAFIVMLLIIPLVVHRFSKLQPTSAFAIAMLYPWLFGPTRAAFDFPALPAFLKQDLAGIGALVGTILYSKRRLSAVRPKQIVDVFFGLYAIAIIAGKYTNSDALHFGQVTIKGTSLTEAPNFLAGAFVTVWIPLSLGRAHIRTRQDIINFLHILAVAGLIYVPLMLWELRMSPQLHRNVYDMAPSGAFGQNIRDGGYRPMVFLGHGLPVGMFVMGAAMSAVTLLKVGKAKIWRFPTRAVVALFTVMSVLVKAKAATLYLIVGISSTFWLKPRTRAWTASVLSLIIFVYATAHIKGVFPMDEILEQLAPYGEERLQSMEFRFDNELALAERAAERVYFGWGGWGRERVRNSIGEDISVQDGAWIIRLGQYGLIGFIGFFGALAWCVVSVALQIGRIRASADKQLVASMALVTSFYIFDMIPNGGTGCMVLVFAGATLGLLEGIQVEQRKAVRRRRASQRIPPRDGESPTP